MPTSLRVRLQTDKTTPGTEEWLRSDDGATRVLETMTENVSIGGMKLRVPDLLEAGSPLTLQTDLDGTQLDVGAAVAHAVRDDFGATVGVTFTDLDTPSATRLGRFMSKKERRRLPCVLAMYPVLIAGPDGPRGMTESCSPGFITLLLNTRMPPGARITAVVGTPGSDIHLRGQIVCSALSIGLWHTQVELDESPLMVTARWSEIVLERRAALRLRDEPRASRRT